MEVSLERLAGQDRREARSTRKLVCRALGKVRLFLAEEIKILPFTSATFTQLFPLPTVGS